MPEFITSNLNAIAQGIGVAAVIVLMLSFQSDKRKTILFSHIFASSLWSCHYLCLGVTTGMIMNLIGLLRSIVYYNRDKRWASSNVFPYVFAAAFLVAGAATYSDWSSLLPIVSMIAASFVMWLTSTKKLRAAYLPCSALWLAYNLINGSWAGAANEILVISSIFAAMLRFDRAKKKEDL